MTALLYPLGMVIDYVSMQLYMGWLQTAYSHCALQKNVYPAPFHVIKNVTLIL